MTAEEWRPVPGLPDYEVSDQGRVRSWKVYNGQPGPRVLHVKPGGNQNYPRVHIRRDGRTTRATVHVLMAAAFLGPRPPGLVVRHLDGNNQNNVIANLTYGTWAENNLDTVLHGTHNYASRTHCKHNHEYTPDNTSWETGSNGRAHRHCRACQRERARATTAA